MTEHREAVWLTIQEYAQTRKLSESTVRRMIKLGMLPVDRVSPRRLRIRMTKVVRSGQDQSHAPTS
jgi:hypothetical protein